MDRLADAMAAISRALICTLLSLTLSAPASAHQRVVRSSPADGARLTNYPSVLRFVFAESARLALFSVQLIGPDGRPVALGTPSHPGDSSRVVVTGVSALLTPGKYEVRWRAAGPDGHPARGTIRFTLVGAPRDSGSVVPAESAGLQGHAGADSASPGQRVAPDALRFDVESPVYVVARWFHFAALVALLGVFFFQAVVVRTLRRDEALSPFAASLEPTLRWAAVASAVGVLVAAGARYTAQLAVLRAAAGPGAGLTAAGLLDDPLWRAALLAQAAGALMVLGAAVPAWRGGRGWLLGAGALTVSLGPALTGHAAAAPNAPLAIAFDLLHVISGGAWLGGLVVLGATAIPTAARLAGPERTRTILALLRAFTPLALVGAATLVISGLYASWIHVGSFPALIRADYGRVLLIKLVLVAVMALLGALNWRHLGPRVGEHSEVVALRRSSRLEIALGIMVLLVTAVLVALPAPVDLIP